MDKNTFFSLLDKYRDGTASQDEKALIETYYRRLEATGQTELSPEEESKLKEVIWGNIMSGIKGNTAPVIPLRRRIYYRIAVAAAVLLLLSAGGYFYFNSKQQQIAVIQPAKDVEAPKGTKARITLSNGQIIPVDSIISGTLATQGNVKVLKTQDGIVYNGPSTNSGSSEVVYNTLTNPRGSKVIDMTLADGSRIWLNAGSTLTYPVAFIGKERKVSITGEAYFEITHDAEKPFTVSKGAMAVRVLGTHFNVNGYDDEDNIKVTLLEGSVKVTSNTSSALLKPGQQAQVSDHLNVVEGVDVNAVIAWKNGQFVLKGTDVATLLRQIARWYDVDIVLSGKMPEKKFGGSVSRDVNLSAMLQALNENGVACKLQGRKIIVE